MPTLNSKPLFAVKKISFSGHNLLFQLQDNRQFMVSLQSFPLLRNATPEQLANYRFIGHGRGINWPDLDEDLSIDGLMKYYECIPVAAAYVAKKKDLSFSIITPIKSLTRGDIETALQHYGIAASIGSVTSVQYIRDFDFGIHKIPTQGSVSRYTKEFVGIGDTQSPKTHRNDSHGQVSKSRTVKTKLYTLR